MRVLYLGATHPLPAVNGSKMHVCAAWRSRESADQETSRVSFRFAGSRVA